MANFVKTRVGIHAHNLQYNIGELALNQRQHVAAEPEHRINVGPIVHLAGKEQARLRFGWRCRMYRIFIHINAVGNNVDVGCAIQLPQRLPVGVAHGGNRISHPAYGAFIANQFAPLHQAIERGGPARGRAQIGHGVALLQQIFTVVVIKYERRSVRLPSGVLDSLAPVLGYFNPFHLHNIIARMNVMSGMNVMVGIGMSIGG